MLVLQNLETNKSFEVSWIYDRGTEGYYILVDNGKDQFKLGNPVSLALYSPKLDKKIKSTVSHIEKNPANSNVCLALKDKKYMAFFKQVSMAKNPKSF